MGIDYGLGRTNIDHETGIRFGVIPAHDLGQSWYESSESIYPEPCCPKCGDESQGIDGAEQDYAEENPPRMEEDEDGEEVEVVPGLEPCRRGSCADYGCARCGIYYDSDDIGDADPIGFKLEDGEYRAYQSGDDCDVFIEESPYYTFAPFCSPCVPGAVYLRDGDRDGDARGYCFGHDWFDGGVAPYPVFLVADDSEVYPTGLSF